MKKILPIIMAFASSTAMAQTSAETSQELEAVYLTCISDNGQWVAGQAEGEGVIYVRNLVNNTFYVAGTNTGGTGYVMGTGKAVSNDGTVIALSDGLPYYWTPTGSKGKWTKLPGNGVDGSCMLGSISADSRMIVGSTGSSGLDLNGNQMAYPCIWHLQEDGSYSDPDFLPNPLKDFLRHTPQKMNAVAISDDCNVIAANMIDGYGFYSIPYIYTKNESGEWTYQDIGTQFINPNNLEYGGQTGITLDDLQPQAYLDDDQFEAYLNDLDEWKEAHKNLTYPSDEYTIAWYRFMAEYMTEKDSKTFLEQLEQAIQNIGGMTFADFTEALRKDGINFDENQAVVTPDGKYVVFAGVKTTITDPTLGSDGIKKQYAPVLVEVATGEATVYDLNDNVMPMSITSDLSIVGRRVQRDPAWPDAGWIYPQGNPEGMIIPEYIKQKGSKSAYSWMEENMYREVIVDYDPDTEKFKVDDAWTVGYPRMTPDMKWLISANLTNNWMDSYYGNFSYISFVVETGIEGVGGSGVDNVFEDCYVSLFPGGIISVSGSAREIEVYNLSGARVFTASNASGTIHTGLTKGVYVVRVYDANGNAKSVKALF